MADGSVLRAELTGEEGAAAPGSLPPGVPVSRWVRFAAPRRRRSHDPSC
jgi:hypothetical protein